jgi:hypothetical protein
MFHLYNGPYRCTTTQESLLSMFCYGFVLFLYCQLRESESVMAFYCTSDIHLLGNDKVKSMEYKITSDIN